MSDYINESEYLQMQDNWDKEDFDWNVDISVSLNIVKSKCIIEFSSCPERKVRKRLRDFKFKWDEKGYWEGDKLLIDKVAKYLKANTKYELSEVQK